MNYFALIYVYISLTPGMEVMIDESVTRFATVNECANYMTMVQLNAYQMPFFEGYRQHGAFCVDVRDREAWEHDEGISE